MGFNTNKTVDILTLILLGCFFFAWWKLSVLSHFFIPNLVYEINFSLKKPQMFDLSIYLFPTFIPPFFLSIPTPFFHLTLFRLIDFKINCVWKCFILNFCWEWKQKRNKAPLHSIPYHVAHLHLLDWLVSQFSQYICVRQSFPIGHEIKRNEKILRLAVNFFSVFTYIHVVIWPK